MELASTAMVGLGEGARYVVEYPYGCAEQRSSRALALLLAADLGEAFSLPDINPKDLKTISQAQITQLEQYQCPGGGFAYWPGECSVRVAVSHQLRAARLPGRRIRSSTR